MRTITIIACMLVSPLLLALGGCSGGSSGMSVGDPASDFTLEAADGGSFTLSEHRGEVVVLDFWATWCGPCRAAMPHVQELHESFHEQGVLVYGVNVWEKGDPVGFMRDNGYTYGLLMEGDDVAEDYGVEGIPTFVIVGKDGTISYKSVGFSGKDALTKAVEGALADGG
jgi:thiol-disulfide isomerase/thioredoxin